MFKECSNIVIYSKRRSHTSKHNIFDVNIIKGKKSNANSLTKPKKTYYHSSINCNTNVFRVLDIEPFYLTRIEGQYENKNIYHPFRGTN